MMLAAGHRPASPSGRDRAVTACVACLALAAWILCHPYYGIVHDNRIYALLALNHADPSLFARDLFLKHGSQDSFTLFSPLYAWVIGLFGLDWSTRLLVAAGQAAWILCALALIRRIVAARFVWLALLFLAAYPPYYGGNAIFSLAEGFLSPRLFAEALGLAAIAAFLGGRAVLASLLLLAGGTLHPLMIAAPAGVILTMALARNAAWWAPAAIVAAGAVALLLVLAVVHLAGLPLLPAIDAQWKFIVGHRTAQFMLANWDWRDWLLLASDAVILALAAIPATRQVRQLLAASLAIGVASLVVSVVGFELLDDLLTGKLQVWRALWLVHALAPVALALLVQDVSARHTPDRRLLLVLAFGFAALTTICFGGSLPPLGLPAILLFAAVYLSHLKENGGGEPRRQDRAIIWISLAAIVMVGLLYLILMIPPASYAIAPSFDNLFHRRVLAGLAILLAGFLLFSDRAARHGRLLAIVAAMALAGIAVHWDQRSDWRRYLDSAPDIAPELAIKPGELVYWPTDVMALWGALRNPSFYSDVQGAGVIFNRETAIEYLDRLARVERFEPAKAEAARLLGKPDGNILTGTQAELSAADLVSLCANPDHPDVVVLSQDIAGLRKGSWRPGVAYQRTYLKVATSTRPTPDDVGKETIDQYFIYRCQHIMQDQRGTQ